MKKSTKALLLSALVFPGAGHLFLKYYLRGAALMVLSLAGLAIIVVDAVQQALGIFDKLQNGTMPLDANAISGLLTNSASSFPGWVLNIASYGIVLCWIIGIFDSYRMGKSQDAANIRDEQ
jgi:hypothetical protein